MNDSTIYKNEFIRIEEDNILSKELINKMRLFFEWNSLSMKLKNLDRESSLSFIQESFDNGKILSGSEVELNRINLYKADKIFRDFLNLSNFDDYAIDQLKLIFSIYLCLSANSLQQESGIVYIKRIIAEVSNKEIQEQVFNEFENLESVIKENRIRRSKEKKGQSKFLIERKTIRYFKLSNLQIVNALNKTKYPYLLESNEIGDLLITFNLDKKKLKIMDIILIAIGNGISLPIRMLGCFKEE